MDKREAVMLASRALALYLICWALSDITHLPQIILEFRHHGTAAAHDFSWNYYRVDLTFYIVRIVALLVTAEWLIKGGNGVHKYFLPSDPENRQVDVIEV